jgi:hypothetical protein
MPIARMAQTPPDLVVGRGPTLSDLTFGPPIHLKRYDFLARYRNRSQAAVVPQQRKLAATE